MEVRHVRETLFGLGTQVLSTWQQEENADGGWMWMDVTCFRSSPHHGRRADGALVMMVLNKSIEIVNLDTRSELPAAWCGLVADWQ
jgi:hypothetical protein